LRDEKGTVEGTRLTALAQGGKDRTQSAVTGHPLQNCPRKGGASTFKRAQGKEKKFEGY